MAGGITAEKALRRNGIVNLQAVMESMPENLGVDPFPLTHHFTTGCYAREILIPKDATIVGKIHKYEHFIVFLSGDVTVASEIGTERITGAHFRVSPAGTKRAIYAHEDSVIITIHPTDETELTKIEADVIAKDFSEVDT